MLCFVVYLSTSLNLYDTCIWTTHALHHGTVSGSRPIFKRQNYQNSNPVWSVLEFFFKNRTTCLFFGDSNHFSQNKQSEQKFLKMVLVLVRILFCVLYVEKDEKYDSSWCISLSCSFVPETIFFFFFWIYSYRRSIIYFVVSLLHTMEYDAR